MSLVDLTAGDAGRSSPAATAGDGSDGNGWVCLLITAGDGVTAGDVIKTGLGDGGRRSSV